MTPSSPATMSLMVRGKGKLGSQFLKLDLLYRFAFCTHPTLNLPVAPVLALKLAPLFGTMSFSNSWPVRMHPESYQEHMSIHAPPAISSLSTRQCALPCPPDSQPALANHCFSPLLLPLPRFVMTLCILAELPCLTASHHLLYSQAAVTPHCLLVRAPYPAHTPTDTSIGQTLFTPSLDQTAVALHKQMETTLNSRVYQYQ